MKSLIVGVAQGWSAALINQEQFVRADPFNEGDDLGASQRSGVRDPAPTLKFNKF